MEKKNGKGILSGEYGIIFGGEYLNGKNWNGKLYDIDGNLFYELKEGKGLMRICNGDNALNYEGEFLNGEINGKVREYNNEGKVKFEGEYLDGKRNGKAKEYDNKGKIKFECEYLYDHKIKVKEYSNGILSYEGEYSFDKKLTGKGYYEKGNLTYELINGNGRVIEYDYEGKLIFEGEYLNGIKWIGHNKEYEIVGKLKFQGEYLGDYRKKGKEYVRGILTYEGEYYKDKKWTGKGYDKNGNLIYELINGNGKVKEYDYDFKLVFEGEYWRKEKNIK